MYKDGNGFPVTLKPSHLFGSTERMDVAEVLSAIVEQACLYTPEPSAGETMKRSKAFTEVKDPKEALTEVKVPKEALTEVKVPKEALTSAEKVPIVASDLVRLKLFRLACFKAVSLPICLVIWHYCILRHLHEI